MIDIYIPSYKRPNATLIRKFAAAGVPFTIVIDHQPDLADYAKWQSDSIKIWMLEEAKGIGYIRQRIKERWSGRPVMMMDDDTALSLRDEYEPTKLKTCTTSEQVRRWVDIMDKFCQEYKFDLGSAADAVFKYKETGKVLRSGSLASVTIFNSPRCREIDYDPKLYRRMEDHDYVLQAITKRHTFLICNDALRHCPMNKAGKDIGGCSEVYRDRRAMFATTAYLVNKWGADIVKCSQTKKIGDFCDFSVNYKEMRRRCGYDY